MRSRDFLKHKAQPPIATAPAVPVAPAETEPVIQFMHGALPGERTNELGWPETDQHVLANMIKQKEVKVISPDEFMSVFFKHLIEAKNKYPEQYDWQGTDVLEVFRRFSESFRNGTYTRHCHAVKWTCKELKIKWERTAINAIFEGESK